MTSTIALSANGRYQVEFHLPAQRAEDNSAFTWAYITGLVGDAKLTVHDGSGNDARAIPVPGILSTSVRRLTEPGSSLTIEAGTNDEVILDEVEKIRL